jgi:hypothetical protein
MIRSLIIWGLIVAALLLPGYRPAMAANISIEAENYFAFNEILSIPIGTYTSGTVVYLRGLDYPGEWTKYFLPVFDFGSYNVTMSCWGDLGVYYHLRLYIIPQSGGDTQTIDFEFVGNGCFV